MWFVECIFFPAQTQLPYFVNSYVIVYISLLPPLTFCPLLYPSSSSPRRCIPCDWTREAVSIRQLHWWYQSKNRYSRSHCINIYKYSEVLKSAQKYTKTRYDATWYDMTWHDMIWHDMTWHDYMTQCTCSYLQCSVTTYSSLFLQYYLFIYYYLFIISASLFYLTLTIRQ